MLISDLDLVAAETPTALKTMQHEFYYAVLYLVAAETPTALETNQHVTYDTVLDFDL